MNHLRTLWKGFRRMIFAVGAAGLLWVALKGFASIPNESGYMAVTYFVMDSTVFAMGMYGMYLMGGTCKKQN